MYVKGVSFSSCPTETVTVRRSVSHIANKKLQYDFQKFRCPQLKLEEVQLQESLKLLDRYFQAKRSKYASLIEMSHNTLLRDSTSGLVQEKSKGNICENQQITPRAEIEEKYATTKDSGQADRAPSRSTVRDIYTPSPRLIMSRNSHRRVGSDGSRQHKRSLDKHLLKHLTLMSSLLQPCKINKVELRSRVETQSSQTARPPLSYLRGRQTAEPHFRKSHIRPRSLITKQMKIGAWQGFVRQQSEFL